MGIGSPLGKLGKDRNPASEDRGDSIGWADAVSVVTYIPVGQHIRAKERA
jgi:hypothetical protein